MSKQFVEPSIIPLAPLAGTLSKVSEPYVVRVGTAYRLTDSRVSLDSIIYAFLSGQSPESIAESFPTLALEQVYGAITFYLSNREEIDAYLRQGEEEFDLLRKSSRESNPQLYKKLEEVRRQTVRERS